MGISTMVAIYQDGCHFARRNFSSLVDSNYFNVRKLIFYNWELEHIYKNSVYGHLVGVKL